MGPIVDLLSVQDRTSRDVSRMIARRSLHRTVFVAAGIYNMAWGLWSIADP